MLTPGELQDLMLDASATVQALITSHEGYVRDQVEAEDEAKYAEATAYLASSGTVAERQAHVTKATHDERFRAEMAKGLRESSKLAIQAAMARLSALQSLASTMREEARLARTGEGP